MDPSPSKKNFIANGTKHNNQSKITFKSYNKSLNCIQAPLSMGILQARILEWVAIPSSRGSFPPRDWTKVSHIAGRFFTAWATREAPWRFRTQNYTNIYSFL